MHTHLHHRTLCGEVETITNNAGNTTTFNSYHGQGQPLTITDANGVVTQLMYDARLRLTSRQTETYAYDSSNRLQSLVDKNTNRVFYNVYNATNQVLNQTLADAAYWQFEYASPVTTVTDPNGHILKDTFNASGYLTNQVLAFGLPEQQTYVIARNGANLVTSVTDQLSRVTTYNNYDAYGHPASVTQLSGTANAVTTSLTYDPQFQQLASITDPLSHTTSYGYDAFGKLNKVTNALNNSWAIFNNAQGLPTSITDPLGHTSQIGYEQADVSSVQDALGRKSTFFTDEVGRVITASDPLGNVFQYGYDARDQLLTVTDPNNGVTTMVYDANGNVTSVQDPRKLATHGFTPDSRNRVHIYTDPLGHTATYNYDGMGNLTSVTDRKNQLTKYSYDGINRLHMITYPDASTLTISWDGGDRPQTFVDTLNGTVSQTYDGLDRLTQESGPQGTIGYKYDAAGRRSQVTITGQSQPLIYAFDAANRLTSITQGTVAVGWNYDTANRFTGISLPNGITSTVVPDAADETTSITYAKGATTIGSVTYGYDADGRRNSASGTLVRPILDAGLTGTTYDAGNHLTQLSTGALTYDADGNLQTQTAQSKNPACNAAQAVSFIRAHQADAATVAQQLGVPTQNVLGLSGIESQWGTSNAAGSANNFFGLHGGSNAPFANGSWYTSGGVQMSSFPSYLASAQSFAAQHGSGVSGISNPTAFAQALVQAGFNPATAPLGNPNFVADTANTINMTAIRMQQCGP